VLSEAVLVLVIDVRIIPFIGGGMISASVLASGLLA
jgi:hypothetical protein